MVPSWPIPALRGAPARGGACQDLAVVVGAGDLRPLLALRPSARAGCHWHLAGCGPGCGAQTGPVSKPGVRQGKQSRRILAV